MLTRLRRRLHRHRICTVITERDGDKAVKVIKPSLYIRVTGKPIHVFKDECAEWIKDIEKHEKEIPFWEKR